MAARRVLIVDDHPDQVATLAILLEESGHRVEYATNALYAFGLARQFQPEVVLLDLGMPYMNGYEAVGQFRALFKHARIFAITGRPGADRQRSIDAGFEEHLVKPLDYGELEQLLA